MIKLVSIILTLICIQSFGQNWQQIGPKGGYFKEFTFHPTIPSIIYAGSDDGGGVWKSTDGGNNWDLLTTDFPNMTGWSITIDPVNAHNVYACDVYSRYGILKSTDGGSTWSQIVNGLSSQYDRMVSGIALKNSDTLFISTGEGAATNPPRPGNGVFRSDNGGSSWIPAGLQDTTVLSIGSNVFGTIFAGTESYGLKFSNDNGSTWSTHPQINSTSRVYELEVQDSVVAVASTAGIYLSSDWGINFTNTGLTNNFNFDVSIQEISPTIELWSTSYAGLQNYSSITGNWTLVSHPLIDNKLVIGIGAKGNSIMIGTFTNAPIYLSNDSGTNWTEAVNSPSCTELNGLNIDPNNSNKMRTCLLGTYGFSTNDQCIYETIDAGNSWTRKGPNAHALCITSNPENFNTSFVGTFSQGLFKSTDGFDSFTNVINGNTIADVIVSASDTNIVLVSEVAFPNAYIKRSTDGGSTYTTVNNLAVNRLTFNTSNNDTVYAATFNGVYRSIDYGITWDPWVLGGTTILSLRHHNNTLYAGTNDGILYKIVGVNVTDVSGIWDTPVQIKSIYQTGSNLFVGLNGAEQDTTALLHGSIWTSINEGQSWANITTNMSSTNAYGNNVMGSVNSELLLATYGGGIFKSNNIILNVSESRYYNQQLQLFPNPTEDYINVNAFEPIQSYSLIDMNGRIVKFKFVSQLFSSKLRINISDLDSGIYTLLIQLENNKTVANKVYKQ